jgi:hypothetical protein
MCSQGHQMDRVELAGTMGCIETVRVCWLDHRSLETMVLVAVVLCYPKELVLAWLESYRVLLERLGSSLQFVGLSERVEYLRLVAVVAWCSRDHY